AVALAVLAPGLPGRTAGPEAIPATGDWLVFGNTAEPSTLNCALATEWSARMVCRLITDTLVDFDQDFHFIPRLASSYEISPDGLTLVFHLRKGVRWHDGTPFTSRDVLDTVE